MYLFMAKFAKCLELTNKNGVVFHQRNAWPYVFDDSADFFNCLAVMRFYTHRTHLTLQIQISTYFSSYKILLTGGKTLILWKVVKKNEYLAKFSEEKILTG